MQGKLIRGIVGAIFMGVLMVAFTNCGSQFSFSPTSDTLELTSLGGATNNEKVVSTKKNSAVDFDFDVMKVKEGWTLSFDQENDQLRMLSDYGVYEVKAKGKINLRFTPKENFIGQEIVKIYLKDKYGNKVTGTINMTIGSVLSHMEPALAIRGIGCVSCHAQVASNFVTDFGYKGDSKSNDYYFNASNTWKKGFYGDHGADTNSNSGAISTLRMFNGANMIVPKAFVPSEVISATNKKTLADFINYRLENSDSERTEVREVASLTISAPSADRFRQVFKAHQGQNFKYIKENQYSPDLVGLTVQTDKQLFSITGTMICDGDLFLDGTLYINKGTIKSITGCRLYVTGSVFIVGGLTSQAANESSELHNVQISSSRAITMGAGKIRKNSQLCEKDGWYKDNYANSDISSLDIRLNHFVKYNAQTRDYAPDKLKSLILEEVNKLPPLYDATCESNGRNVSFSRVLFNAPWVMSRYYGNVQGSIVAEAALMALGNFKFAFDPVFKQVSILPMLDENEILNIREK